MQVVSCNKTVSGQGAGIFFWPPGQVIFTSVWRMPVEAWSDPSWSVTEVDVLGGIVTLNHGTGGSANENHTDIEKPWLP